jgi:hypothetical protein
MLYQHEWIELENDQDEIYYWLVFTVFFSVLSVIGSALFVVSYKLMLYFRKKRIMEKARSKFALSEPSTFSSANSKDTNQP